MSVLQLIADGKLEEFEVTVFGRTLGIVCDDDGCHTYVLPLSSDEEVALLLKALEVGGQWMDFALRYNETYPFTNKCDRVLVDNMENKSEAYNLLKMSLVKYGFNEEIGLKICDIILKKDFTDEEFIEVFCKSGRILYPEIAGKLGLLSAKWSKLYADSVSEYKNKSKK